MTQQQSYAALNFVQFILHHLYKQPSDEKTASDSLTYKLKTAITKL